MDRDEAIAIVQREAGRVLALATDGDGDGDEDGDGDGDEDRFARPVPSCPGWDFGDLVKHLGNAYNWAGTIVGERLLAPPGPGMPRRGEETSLPDWMSNRLDRLVSVLTDVPDDVPIWNFGPDSPSSAGFWRRRMMHETAIHRVDAELAAGADVSPFEPDLAADTVSELLAILHFSDVTDGDTSPPSSRTTETMPLTVHLHATDTEGAEWTLDTTARTVTRRHAKGDVAIRGTAWALARWCWGRPVEGEIEVFGDLSPAEAWRCTVVP
ncbi:MAG TPA: maleylpyruvate isomerase family mycothiol-dependent enzyme [Acidimicrobiales bacterium]|nr:maleylpyruvate isomerase family mycothiol-dependent enzyme [Acidimicrobiales bacterium]